MEDLLKGNLTADIDGVPKGLPSLADHQLYFFGLSGDAADLSYQADRELKIRDLVEANNQ